MRINKTNIDSKEIKNDENKMDEMLTILTYI